MQTLSLNILYFLQERHFNGKWHSGGKFVYCSEKAFNITYLVILKYWLMTEGEGIAGIYLGVQLCQVSIMDLVKYIS